MGRDKACIPVDGVPMLRRVYNVAIECTNHVSVVTPWPQRYQPLLPPSCHWIVEPLFRETPVELATANPNRRTQTNPQGPLIGFAHGLNTLASKQPMPTWVMLLACDLPCLDAGVLKAWITHLPSVRPEAIAVLPSHTNGWEPLCGFYRGSCLTSINQFIDGGGRSFQRWIRTEQVDPLPADDISMNAISMNTMMLNCNTPEDLEQAMSS